MFASSFLRKEQIVIGYLQTENQILREELEKARGKKRLLLSNSQKRKLARWAKLLGSKVLKEIDTFFTPNTLLKWHRMLVAQKYTSKKKAGRKPIDSRLRDLVIKMAEENES